MALAPDPVDPVSTAAMKAAAGPITEGGGKMLTRVFGPSLDEFADYLRDKVTLWRAGRGVYTFERAAEMLAAAGLEPRKVKMKALVSIMEGATLEDDDDLSEMWAALLANASAEDLGGVEASFAAILRQLSTVDTVILQAAYALPITDGRFITDTLGLEVVKVRRSDTPGVLELSGPALRYEDSQRPELKALADLPVASLGVSADNLIRLGLLSDVSTQEAPLQDKYGNRADDPNRIISGTSIKPTRQPRTFVGRSAPTPDRVHVPSQDRTAVKLSRLGTAFMEACAAPSAG